MEIWDILDESGNRMGRTIIRGEKLEVDDVKWVKAEELKRMIAEGSFFRDSDDYYYKLLSKYIRI